MPNHGEISVEGIAKLEAMIEKERLSGRPIPVSPSIRAPHPQVTNAKSVLSKRKVNDRQVVSLPGLNCLDIKVSPQCLGRALCLMDTILKELESRKHKVTIRQVDGKYFTTVSLEGEELWFGIDEKVNRTKRLYTKEELKRQWLPPSSDYKYEFKPNGQFALKIRNFDCYNVRKIWSDSTTHKIEALLGSFVIGLMSAAIAIKRRKIEREIERRKRAESEEKRQEVLQKIREEEAKLQKLEDDASSWQKSQLLRSYVSAVKEKARGDEEYSRRYNIEDWSDWALRHADRLDPLIEMPS